MKKMLFNFAIIIILLSPAALLSQQNDAICGKWFTENSKAKVEIVRSGNVYNGKIVWLKEPLNKQGKPKIDANNPDASKRNNPLVGLELIKGFKYDEDNVYEDGEIYDPESGKLYSCKMTLSKDGKTLDVRGYIGISLFGRTQTWTRAKD